MDDFDSQLDDDSDNGKGMGGDMLTLSVLSSTLTYACATLHGPTPALLSLAHSHPYHAHVACITYSFVSCWRHPSSHVLPRAVSLLLADADGFDDSDTSTRPRRTAGTTGLMAYHTAASSTSHPTPSSVARNRVTETLLGLLGARSGNRVEGDLALCRSQDEMLKVLHHHTHLAGASVVQHPCTIIAVDGVLLPASTALNLVPTAMPIHPHP